MCYSSSVLFKLFIGSFLFFVRISEALLAAKGLVKKFLSIADITRKLSNIQSKDRGDENTTTAIKEFIKLTGQLKTWVGL